MTTKHRWTPEERAQRLANTARLDRETAEYWDAKYPKAAARRAAAKRAAAKRGARHEAQNRRGAYEASKRAAAPWEIARAAYATAESRIWSDAYQRARLRPSQYAGDNKAQAAAVAGAAVTRWQRGADAQRLKALADAEAAAAADISDLL